MPKPFRRKPHDIIAVALYGRNLGLDPMLSMQYIHVVDGKPTMSAEGMVALVRSKGHTIRALELTDDKAVAYGQRRDTGDEATFDFTRAHADAAGLSGKQVWKAYFRSMAWARVSVQVFTHWL